MEQSSPADLSENPAVTLPPVPQHIAKEHPDVWAALQQLGAALSQAGPLDGRTKRLVHLALALGVNSRGAVHSHARRGLAEGLSAAELEHVALLAGTTLGWPQAVKGVTWIKDVTQELSDE
ncbi:MAG: carboxymuconolactone decarboxylase family protein [Mycobacterium sp.]|jgi:alkylhydroperoxidase/carboxymuconolactone decarboxylase family protein YurZ|nr:carboxymuconolactone decarboxylase family protein [Mycobacterium sp.]